eukprot:213377-Karenia_brevis.AAC.1
MAQTPASFIIVGPQNYLWRLCHQGDRPMQKFRLSVNGDYYQGWKQFGGHFLGVYWPSDKSRMIEVDDQGYGNIQDVLKVHEKLLVVGSGRGVYWSNAIKNFDDDEDGLSKIFRIYGLSWQSYGNAWGAHCVQSKGDSYRQLVNDCERCRYSAIKCRKCLRRIKRWAGLPNRKW